MVDLQKVSILHNEAMNYAEQAFIMKFRGANLNENNYMELFNCALKKEVEAAHELLTSYEIEPTRSVLFRSAATLALDCGEVREAEKLVAMGLSGNPPEEIATELRDILETVNFNRHLNLNGITLDETDVQISIAGDAISYGMVESSNYIDRIQNYQKIIIRTAERIKGEPFREKGKAKSDICDNLKMYVSVSRAASFAVTLRFGHTDQIELPEMDSYTNKVIAPSEIIAEALTCIDLFNSGNEKLLKDRINDDAYLNNFKGLVQKLSPDGKQVNLVGFTSFKNGNERRVELRRQKGSEKVDWDDRKISINKKRGFEVIGEFQFADSRSVNNQKIIVTDEHSVEHIIIVPPGMMADIVKPLWEDTVIVKCKKKKGKNWMLDNIEPYDNM